MRQTASLAAVAAGVDGHVKRMDEVAAKSLEAMERKRTELRTQWELTLRRLNSRLRQVKPTNKMLKDVKLIILAALYHK